MSFLLVYLEPSPVKATNQTNIHADMHGNLSSVVMCNFSEINKYDASIPRKNLGKIGLKTQDLKDKNTAKNPA